jgi:hypothetical protein
VAGSCCVSQSRVAGNRFACSGLQYNAEGGSSWWLHCRVSIVCTSVLTDLLQPSVTWGEGTSDPGGLYGARNGAAGWAAEGGVWRGEVPQWDVEWWSGW